MIDRVFTKAEAATSRTGRARRPTWRTRRAPATWSCSRTRRTSSTRRRRARWSRRSHFFGQHGYVPDVQDLDRQRQHAGDVPRRRRGDRQGHGQRSRSIDLAPTIAYLLRHPRAAAQPRAACCSRCSRAASGVTPLSIIGLNDFHGQLDPTTMAFDGHQRRRSAAPRSSRRCSTRTLARLPGPGAAPRRRRQRRRLAAELGPARGHAGDRRRERLGPGRDVVRQPRVRLRRRAAAPAPGARQLPVPRRRTSSRRPPARRRRLGDAVGRVHRQRRQGRRDRRRAREHAGARLGRATAGLDVPRRRPSASRRVRAPAQGRASRCRSW